MKGKLFLIHWDAAEAEAYAEQLRAWGWAVSGVEAEDGGRAYRLVRDSRPDVLVVYLTRRPGHGRETARALRDVKATRALPIIFVGGEEEAVASVRAKVPAAIYVPAEGLAQALQPFSRAAWYDALVPADRERALIDWYWMRQEPIEGVAFMLNDPVRVMSGPHASLVGTVISLLALEPEPRYQVELSSGAYLELPQSELRSAHSEEPGSALAELQHWYATQTDSDWEHSFGVSIATLDNPGWSLRIDLSGTELADHPFAEVSNLNSKHDWLTCRVQDAKFEAAAGPHMLERVIRIFLDWARTAAKPGA